MRQRETVCVRDRGRGCVRDRGRQSVCETEGGGAKAARLKRHKWLLIIPRCKVDLEAAVGRKDVAGAMQETAKTLQLAGGKKLRVCFFFTSHFFFKRYR